jgi:hypothetical protein
MPPHELSPVKTKYVGFHRKRKTNSVGAILMYDENEIGLPTDVAEISVIERVAKYKIF